MSKKSPHFSSEQIQTVARMFKVLGDATRLSILRLLFEKPLTVSELVLALESKQANISKQLGMLHDAGLVSRQRSGNQVTYTISDPMISELCQLVCHKLQRDAVSHAKTMGIKASALR